MPKLKAMGFLLNRGTEEFSGRIVPAGCVFSAADLQVISEIADRFGSGKVAFTTRLTAEIVGIPYENIEGAVAYAAERGLQFGEPAPRSGQSPPVRARPVSMEILTPRLWPGKFINAITKGGGT